MKPALVVFDLDHTLLDGDTDELWCRFLIDQGLLDADRFGALDAAMQRDYRAGVVGTLAFCEFYIGTLAGRTAAQWSPLRDRFVAERVLPRLHVAAAALLERHRRQGALMVLSTATNRFLVEPTAQALGLAELIATECDLDAAGRFTGRVAGAPNMREGKVARLDAWLAARGLALGATASRFYSDSPNDLPLLEAVDEPIVTHGDPRLVTLARERGWRELSLRTLPLAEPAPSGA